MQGKRYSQQQGAQGSRQAMKPICEQNGAEKLPSGSRRLQAAP